MSAGAAARAAAGAAAGTATEPGASQERSRFRIGLALLLVILVVLVSLADYGTGSQIEIDFFYLVPIAAATWFVSLPTGLVLAIASTAGWIVADLASGKFYAQPTILYWNAAVELGFFATVAITLGLAKRARDHEHALLRQLETAYRTLDNEMRAVGDIQRSLLPAELPRVEGYRFAVHYSTSTRAGGDYYDFFPLAGGGMSLLLADVSGHGTPAAVVMSMMRALLHTSPDPIAPPDQVLVRLNAQLGHNILLGQFVTACCATLEPGTGRLSYALAGHNPPFLVRGRTGEVIELANRDGPPLGIFDGPTFNCEECTLEPGDTLLLYTDGLTEAADPADEFFGTERVREILRAQRGADAPALRDRMIEALGCHTGGAPMADDLTLLVVRAE